MGTGQSLQSMRLGKRDIHVKKDEIEHLSDDIYKDQLKMH